MSLLASIAVAAAALAKGVSAAPLSAVNSSVQPFEINLSAGVPYMLEKIRTTELPVMPQYPGVAGSKGIDLTVLEALRDQWLNEFDWEKEQEYLNRYVSPAHSMQQSPLVTNVNSFNHYTTVIEGLQIHFVHHKSEDPDAIPIILNHGWPGSFQEFLPMIEPLTQPASSSSGKPVSFNVVIPSLPGFAFSGSPPGNWTMDDTTRVFNTLMTEVLGYSTYAAHGTSNGAILTFNMYDQYNSSTRAAHFPLLPFYPTTTEELQRREIELSPLEQAIHERSNEWSNHGTGYFLMHIYKVSPGVFSKVVKCVVA